MGLKEKMAEKWMGNMNPQQRQEMMEAMMDNFFSKMSAAEKAKMMETMMEKFMAGLSPEEKQAMMGTMMPKMMGSLMGGQGSPQGGMMGLMMGQGGSMREMMSRMMAGRSEGQGESPWDMCRKMMASVSRASEMASFATPEVRSLFEEWAAQIEEEVLLYIKETQITDADQIAARFKLSKNSANFFLTRLAQQGKISLKAEKAAL